MYAIFRAQGKQFRAVPDGTIRIPSLDAAPGDEVTFDDVLLTVRDGDVRIGAPVLDGASVAAEVVGHGREDKIIVYKMKRRKGYRRKQGHRQAYTEIRIVDIAFPSRAPAKTAKEKAAVKAEAEPVAEETEKKAAAKKAAAKKAAAKKAEAKKAEPPAERDAAAGATAKAEAEPAEAGPDITPAALELAQEHGIDLSTIEGTGKDGRILKGDVDRAIKEREGD